jgi:replication-associated recombination protein RarA
MSRFTIDFLTDYSDEAILEELKRLASVYKSSTVTKAQIASSGRVSYALVNKRSGSLRRALQLAGLVVS